MARGGFSRRVDETTSDSAGRYRLAYRPTYTGRYRARALSGGSSETSSSRTIAVRALLSGDGKDHIRKRRTHSVTGTLRPGRAGRVVRLDK